MKLTKASVARLKLAPGKAEKLVFDDDVPGFALRLRDSGSASWMLQYRLGERQRRMTFGRYPAMTVEAARAQAVQLYAKVKLGGDPQRTKVETRVRAADEPLTVGRLVEAFIARHAARRQRPRSLQETVRRLRVHFKPLHTKEAARLTRAEIATRLGEIADTSGGVTANRCRSALGTMYSWAMRAGLVEANPVIGTGKPAEERSRERALSASELRAVWLATEEPGDFNWIVRLLILTGQRREEVAGLRWSELDLGKAMWSLPGERTKNGKPHDVPLSSMALDVLRQVPVRQEPARTGREQQVRQLVFGRGKGSFSGWSTCKRRLDARMAPPMKPWVLHDLRRSVVTGMNDLGIAPHVVEAVVNHVSGHKAGVAGIYNRSVYATEKRQALDRWAQHVQEIVEGVERPKVVPLTRSM